jgi:hypothetical protein
MFKPWNLKNRKEVCLMTTRAMEIRMESWNPHHTAHSFLCALEFQRRIRGCDVYIYIYILKLNISLLGLHYSYPLYLDIAVTSSSLYAFFISKQNIVTCIPIARQRLGKHIPVEAYARNNSTSIAKQRVSKQAFSTIEGQCFLRGPCRWVIRGQRRSFERVVVENWAEFWRWKNRQERN